MNKSKEKGITLIALIITIIILIILLGTTIEMVINSELFNNAKEVTKKSEEQTEQYQNMVNDVRNLYR